MSDTSLVAGNKKIELPSGNTVTIKTSLTAREHLRLKNYIVSKAEMKTNISYNKNGSPKTEVVPKIHGEDIAQLETETISTYVVEFNDDKNNAYNRMLDTISGKEYEVVKETIDNVNTDEEKK